MKSKAKQDQQTAFSTSNRRPIIGVGKEEDTKEEQEGEIYEEHEEEEKDRAERKESKELREQQDDSSSIFQERT